MPSPLAVPLMTFRLAISWFAFACAAVAWPARADEPVANKASAADAPDFNAQVLPLLKAKCSQCHGGEKHEAELDLVAPGGILKGGESGPAVVPGQPEASLLFEKIRDGLMPPEEADRLNGAEVDLLRRWVLAGAPLGDSAADAAPAVTQHDVLPILHLRCMVCHGARDPAGGLDLRTPAGMLRGGKTGPAIVAGDPARSLLVQKVHAGEMPPLKRLIEVSVKPMEPAELATIEKWIALGAPEVDVAPDVATTEPDPLVTDEDRAFWSFQPPRQVAPPRGADGAATANPIDAFIGQKLATRGLTLSPEADRATLLRRVTFDLTGLPPTAEEIRAFLADAEPGAYERAAERLLASPRYGEHWGRHWLDLAGYADSEGKREQDIPRPSAYRYRDYVIRAFNADKPYDRFLLEQIAGDELADYEHAPEITPALYDNLVATGFLRLAPDPTWYNLTNFVPDRLDVVADELDVLTAGVMGLTFKCARCHSHKFDPIPHRDYYRLVDVFKGAFDEHDWMKSAWHGPLSMGQRSDRDLPFVTAAERREWEARQQGLDAEVAAAKAAAGGAEQPSGALDKTLAAIEARRTPAPNIRALWDRGAPSPTYIYRRGDYRTAGRLVGPGVPAVLTDGKTPFVVEPPWPGANKTGRRLAFARWLVRPDHPLTGRVMANRIWKHHFGVGLVSTVDNFGKMGAPPTHPELLDWLAVEFVRGGWSVKAMHRLIVTSATYRQSSAVVASAGGVDSTQADPDGSLYSRMPMQRLSAEQLYDALLTAAGRLDGAPFGPADPVDVRPDGLVTPRGTERGWRRAVYVQQQRKIVVTHFETFDFPQMNPNCVGRRESTVALQALHLFNNGLVEQLAGDFARRVASEAGEDRDRQIERAYFIALSRPPRDEELAQAREFLAKLTDQWTAELGRTAPDQAPQAPQRALATYCHALLNSAEFLYVD